MMSMSIIAFAFLFFGNSLLIHDSVLLLLLTVDWWIWFVEVALAESVFATRGSCLLPLRGILIKSSLFLVKIVILSQFWASAGHHWPVLAQLQPTTSVFAGLLPDDCLESVLYGQVHCIYVKGHLRMLRSCCQATWKSRMHSSNSAWSILWGLHWTLMVMTILPGVLMNSNRCYPTDSLESYWQI